jgi:hypothetical protein
MAQSTPLLRVLPTLLHACGASLSSPLVPLLLDLLWNVLEPMASPRSLSDDVRRFATTMNTNRAVNPEGLFDQAKASDCVLNVVLHATTTTGVLRMLVAVVSI